MKSLNNFFIQKYPAFFPKAQGEVRMSKAQLESLVAYQKINSILGHAETFKLVFGDPAQYKDFDKRAKSFFSPVEQSFYDENNELNTWLNKFKNSAQLVNEDNSVETAELAKDDWFRKDFSDEITSQTVADMIVGEVDTVNSLIQNGNKFSERFRDVYLETNEADGQSIGTMLFGRELMMKNGWRWNDKLVE
jgi:hypothetical protein